MFAFVKNVAAKNVVARSISKVSSISIDKFIRGGNQV